MTTALITGATVGLGRGFAEALARDGHDLVIVARDADRLRRVAAELERTHGITVEVLPADLGDAVQRAVVERRLADRDRPVDVLVNNAGFALRQHFVGGDVEAEERLLEVLVTAPMRLTHAALPGMIVRGRGSILNVSSVASWTAGGTYSADKAWVRVFTESLAVELAETGVTATAVCPGFVHTEFHQRAGLKMGRMPSWMWLSVDQVLSQALRDARRGRAVSVAGPQYRLLSLAAQYAPRPLIRRLTGGRISVDRVRAASKVSARTTAP